MANLTGTPIYVNVLRQLEPTDPAHPNTWNPNYQALLNNDAYLKGFIEGLMKAATGHTHSGVDGDGAKIPISSLKEDIATQEELNSHVGSRGNAHAIVTTTENGFMSNTDKSKLDGIAAGANNYAHPSTHPASMITEETNKRFMTDAERTKLTGIAAGANNYTHPTNHPPSIITQDANNRFVTDAEKENWNAKETIAGAQAKADSAESKSKGYTDQKLTEHVADYVLHPANGGTTAGTATAYTCNSTPNPTALVDKMGLMITAHVDSGANPTLKWGSNAAKSIKKPNGSAANLKKDGLYTIRYNKVNDSFILQGDGGSGNALASDLLSGKTATTDAGDIVGTMTNRGAPTITPTTSDQAITPGYYSGGTVKAYQQERIQSSITVPSGGKAYVPQPWGNGTVGYYNGRVLSVLCQGRSTNYTGVAMCRSSITRESSQGTSVIPAANHSVELDNTNIIFSSNGNETFDYVLTKYTGE